MKYRINQDLILNPSGKEFKAGTEAELDPKDYPDDLSEKLLTILQEQGTISPVEEPPAKPPRQAKAPAET